MSIAHHSQRSITLAATLLVVSATTLLAGSGAWNSTASSDWGTAANWSPVAVPGSTTDIGNRDIATFSKGSGYQFTVIPDAGRIIGSVTFDQASAGNAGNYVIGAVGGTPLTLAGTASGAMQIGATLTTANVTETVNAPLVLLAYYQFINSSPATSTTLRLNGPIYSGTNTAVQIQLKGTNPGANTISGVISNGASTVSILKPQGISSSGTWLLAGTNTYTGTTAISIGTLVAATDAPSGAPGAFGNATSAVTVGDSTSTATNAAALLAGNGATGYTIGRQVTVQALASGKIQTATLGGANTASTSYFTGNVSLNRDVVLQCATGGAVEFKTGTWTSRDKAFTIGSVGNLGTVRIANTLSTTGGVTVAFGKLDVAGAITGTVTTAGGATLAGAGTVKGNVSISANAFVTPGANGVGVLTVNGDATLQPNGRFAIQLNGSSTGRLSVTGNVTLTGAVLDATVAGAPAANVVILHTDGTRTGEFASVVGLPASYTVSYEGKDVVLRYISGTSILIR